MVSSVETLVFTVADVVVGVDVHFFVVEEVGFTLVVVDVGFAVVAVVVY